MFKISDSAKGCCSFLPSTPPKKIFFSLFIGKNEQQSFWIFKAPAHIFFPTMADMILPSEAFHLIFIFGFIYTWVLGKKICKNLFFYPSQLYFFIHNLDLLSFYFLFHCFYWCFLFSFVLFKLKTIRSEQCSIERCYDNIEKWGWEK